MLVLQWDLHRREEQGPHEHVVHAERLFGDVHTEVFTRSGPTELHQHEHAEHERADHPEDRLQASFPKCRGVGLTMTPKIETEQRNNTNRQQYPRPSGYIEVDEVLRGFRGYVHRPILRGVRRSKTSTGADLSACSSLVRSTISVGDGT